MINTPLDFFEFGNGAMPAFGERLGPDDIEDSTSRPKVAELLRFQKSKSGDELISFKEYVDWMKEGQQDIYYITGESVAAEASKMEEVD